MLDRVFLVVTLMALSALAHAGGNLLVNGGFEEPLNEDGSIPGWEANGYLQNQDLSLDDRTHSGAQAACILSTHAQSRSGRSVLSQTAEIEPGRDYQVTLWANRDSFVWGTDFDVVLLKDGEEVGRQNIALRTNNTWRPVTMNFPAGEANQARVELITNNWGDWRITVGRRLWVDDVTLVEVDHERNIQIDGQGDTAAAEVDVTEPGLYHLWARVHCDEPTRFSLKVGDDDPRIFRAYTTGEEYWVRPVIPELLINEGRKPIEVAALDEGARIERVVLTMDPFWEPDGYEPFMDPEDALAAQREAGFEPVEEGATSLTLSAIGGRGHALPPGRRGVSQGVPFPRGVLGDAADIRIADGRPVQARELNRWPDGSIKWLLVSTFAEPNETLTLEYGTAVASEGQADNIRVSEDADVVAIDTGALSFAVPADGPALIENMTGHGRTVESITGLINDHFTTGGEREVEVEESGPVRAVVRIAGPHIDQTGEKLLDYVVRVFAYAGESHVRVEHSFVLRDEIIEVDIDSLVLRMETPVESVVFEGGDALDTSAGEAKLEALLASEDSSVADRPWSVQQDGAVAAEGNEASGRAILQGPSQMVIDMLHFARNAPKSIAVTDRGVDVGLVGGPLTFYKGMMKTHEMVISLGDDGEEVADAFKAQPLLLAEPAWYCDSGATGHRPLADATDAFPKYAASIEATMDYWVYRQERADYRSLENAGMLHCGDAVISGGGNNLESALGEGSMIQFLRTGRTNYFDFADISLRHFSDIDIDHSDSTGGLIYLHGPHSRDRLDYESRGVNGHSWYNGTVLYGLFTGSQRVLDTAPQVGHYYTRWPFDPHTYIHGWRAIAWKFMALNQAFDVTEDVRFLDAALEDLRVTRAQQDQVIHLWPYMFSVGMKAVRQYHDITRDPGARELYLQLMDGFMHLRDRPRDTVNGEWDKTEEQVLGNFPNDRSCAFYNEAAHTMWLSGDERVGRAAGEDLAYQIAFNVSDPTLLWGSADLLRAMVELGIDEPELAADLPATFMTPSHVSDGRDRPTIAMQVVEDEDRDFAIELFNRSYRKYSHDHHGTATVYAPDGTEITSIDVRMSGLRRYRMEVPADGQTGVYTALIAVDDPWRWTREVLEFDLEPGEHTVRIASRYDRVYLDAVCIAKAGEYFPWLDDEPADAAIILQAEDGEMERGYEVLEWTDALGGKAVRAARKTADGGPWLTQSFDVAEAGRYRFFARVWRAAWDWLNVQIDDDEPFECTQTHDMDDKAFQVWSIDTTLGRDAVVTPYCDANPNNNMGPYNPEALKPHPALD